MAETDLKIKDAPLSTNISGNVRMPGSDGSGLPVAISLSQVYDFINNGLKSDGYFAVKTAKMDRLESYTTSTTVASLDVSYRTIYVTLSANASLSASGTGSAYNGRSITAYVYTASSVTITIPTSGDYVSMCGSSFTTTADGWVEFSLVCVNGVWHIAKLEAE